VTATPCPGVEDLRQFRLGRLDERHAAQMESHLMACPACLGRLPSLAPDDALVRGLRAQRGRPRLSNPLLESVRQEVRARPFGPLGETPTQASISSDVTLGAIPALHRPADPVPAPAASPAAAAPRPAPPPSQDLRETYPFIAPPRGPGEVGWLGTYRVLKLLGEGGMGMVLLAEDTRLQRRVALKVMRPALAADPGSRSRFLREARATAALEHDHIVTIHHIEETAGVPFLAMPLLQGETLEDRLRREGLLPLAEVLRIGREVALALSAAHEKGLIHRDIKPANLWLESPSGRVKVLDFGLASMPAAEGDRTIPGTILGTPGYMAPEQTDGQADARADLFSLGCVLYRMATGRLPFKGATAMQKMRSLITDEPAPPQQINPALPGPLCNLIQRLLAKKPEDRPATALAVARVLETLQMQLPGAKAAPVVIPVAADATQRLAPQAVPVPGPTSIPATPALPVGPDRRKLWIGAGVGGGVLLVLLILLAVRLAGPGRNSGGAGGEGERDKGGKKEEDFVARGKARQRVRKDPGENDTPVEPVLDQAFPETWVTRPAAISGLKGWCIETNDAARYPPTAFAFTDDERLLISYTNLGWLQFEPEDCELRPAPFNGYYTALTGDTKTCARAVTGGVELWDEGYPKPRVTLRCPGDTLGMSSFSPGGKLIVTPANANGGYTRDLWFWDVRTGTKVAEVSADSAIRPWTFAWSADGKALAATLFNENAVVVFRSPWKKQEKKIVRPTGVRGLSWSPDGAFLATVEGDNRLHILGVDSGDAVTDVKDVTVAPTLGAPAWSPDGKEVAFATPERRVAIWDRDTAKITYSFAGHTRPVSSVAYLADGKTLISASPGSVRFWDLEHNQLRGSLLHLANGQLAISPEGYYRCTPGAEGRFVFKFREDNGTLRELPPDDFRKLFGWKNHPEKVKLTAD
jgi:serine/threonine protein kinase